MDKPKFRTRTTWGYLRRFLVVRSGALKGIRKSRYSNECQENWSWTNESIESIVHPTFKIIQTYSIVDHGNIHGPMNISIFVLKLETANHEGLRRSKIGQRARKTKNWARANRLLPETINSSRESTVSIGNCHNQIARNIYNRHQQTVWGSALLRISQNLNP